VPADADGDRLGACPTQRQECLRYARIPLSDKLYEDYRSRVAISTIELYRSSTNRSRR